MADDFPDLHHKLCKKLAHLITGFYHLNTKSDEIDYITQNVVETYEREIDKVVVAANTAIKKAIKESAQGVDLLEIRNTYREFKKKIEEERAAAAIEFNDFKQVMKEKDGSVQEDAQKQVNMYQTEVEELKEKLWQMQKMVEKMVGSEIKFDEGEQKAKEAEYQKARKDLEERNREVGELKMRYLELERAYRELEEVHGMSDKGTTNWSRDLNDNEEWEAELLRKRVVEQEKIILALRRAIGQENGVLDGDEVSSLDIGNTNRDGNLQKSCWRRRGW